LKQANPLRWLKKYLSSVSGETADRAADLYERARNAPRVDVNEYAPTFAQGQLDRLDELSEIWKQQRRNRILDDRQDKLFGLAEQALANKTRDRVLGATGLGAGALGTGAALYAALAGDDQPPMLGEGGVHPDHPLYDYFNSPDYKHPLMGG
jgi:hypothetical protein